MKKSNSFITGLLLFSFLAMIASGFSLKSQFDAIDRNDQYYAFEKTQLDKFNYIRMHGNYSGLTLVQKEANPEILIYPMMNDDGTPIVTWRHNRDTLIVSYQRKGNRIPYFPGILTRSPNVVINVPSLNGFVSEGIPAIIQGFKADFFDLRQRSSGVLLKENDFRNLKAEIHKGGEMDVQWKNSFGSTDIILKDSSTFRADRDIFKEFRLHADSSARLELRGSLLKMLSSN